ncbi:MAG TPA: formylglycine-generating enzyme family protein, partial [Gemmataceae bacterium]|nr:formylglycine-generating enzyme family protein [Gemmataceae bacterium]
CDGNYPYGTDDKGPYLGRTSQVGAYATKAPHPWGLCDMHGNVLQWCRDWYDSSYYKISPGVDPLCDGGEQKSRVLRGGSWIISAGSCRAANRNGFEPGFRNSVIGFRVSLRLD